MKWASPLAGYKGSLLSLFSHWETISSQSVWLDLIGKSLRLLQGAHLGLCFWKCLCKHYSYESDTTLQITQLFLTKKLVHIETGKWGRVIWSRYMLLVLGNTPVLLKDTEWNLYGRETKSQVYMIFLTTTFYIRWFPEGQSDSGFRLIHTNVCRHTYNTQPGACFLHV